MTPVITVNHTAQLSINPSPQPTTRPCSPFICLLILPVHVFTSSFCAPSWCDYCPHLPHQPTNSLNRLRSRPWVAGTWSLSCSFFPFELVDQRVPGKYKDLGVQQTVQPGCLTAVVPQITGFLPTQGSRSDVTEMSADTVGTSNVQPPL